jgi:hypothetical protein
MVAFFLRSRSSLTLLICACPLGGGGAIILSLHSHPLAVGLFAPTPPRLRAGAGYPLLSLTL